MIHLFTYDPTKPQCRKIEFYAVATNLTIYRSFDSSATKEIIKFQYW